MEICSRAHYTRMITIKHSGVYYSLLKTESLDNATLAF